MWSEILKINPKVDAAGLDKMEKQLSGRFGKVAKKFGMGIKNAITFGGITALATGVIAKILSPLKETQDTITRILDSSDDIVTSAKQFETSAGKYFKLQQLAKSTGLDEESLKMMLSRFQIALAEERNKVKPKINADGTIAPLDPKNQPGTLANFTQQTDTADAFFQFIQALKQMPKDKQVLVQTEIFGNKAVGKQSEFLNTDFRKQLEIMNAKPAEAYTPALEKTAALADLRDALEAGRNLKDIEDKSKRINKDMILNMAESDKKKRDLENAQLESYNDLKKAAIAGEKIQVELEKSLLTLSKYLPGVIETLSKTEQHTYGVINSVIDMSGTMKKMSESKLFRGILNLGTGMTQRRLK
jgi:hypothetical protein